jgi:hypothetical protein
LDAAFFHLYGIGRDDADYIMETFPIVKRKDEAAYGEYRTKRIILEIYDKMAKAAETGVPYETPLDPPLVDLGPEQPTTVASLQPLSERRTPVKPPEARPEEPPDLDRAAEEGRVYTAQPRTRRGQESEEWPDSTELTLEPEAGHQDRAPRQETSSEPENATHDGHVTPEAPNPYHATLALHACVSDDEKVEREALLHDAARELGYPKLTKKVRRALNTALNAEKNADRLRTDWERVWRPRKK